MRIAKTLLGLFATLLPFTAGATYGKPVHRHAHRSPIVLTLSKEPKISQHAEIDHTLRNVMWLGPPQTFFELHAVAVHNSLLEFEPDLIGVTPILRAGTLDAARAPTNFVPPARTDDLLEQARQKNILQYGSIVTDGDKAAFSTTILCFFALTLMSVKAPTRLRKAFYGSVHLAPATFDGGAMGLGLGGHLKSW